MVSSVRGPASPWRLHFHRPEPSRIRLVCFPHAGGGGAAYHPLSRLLPVGMEVIAIVPPGREARLREAPLTSIAAMAEGAARALVDLPPLPFLFFGHSMGAILAFETAHLLRRWGLALPQRLLLSGRRAPGPPPADETPISGLPNEVFVVEMARRYQGIPQIILADRELLTLLLPNLRSDLCAIETHDDLPKSPLPVPITLMGGMEDPQCTEAAWAGWHAQTTGTVESLRFPGGHFYLTEDRAAVAAAIAARLDL